MSSRSPDPSPIAVVAILADGATTLDHTLEAVAAQAYEPAAIYVVGTEAEDGATALGIPWRKSVQELLAGLDPVVTHVWLLTGGAVPKPDALYALVFESERAGAGIAGSKILELDHTERLISVGMATDVFLVPSVGLDDGELDAGQYDVVRDVAAVAGTSVLARRDLAKGLGGPDPSMAPEALAIDLSQRARVLGARVIVVPSSEVAVPETEPGPTWREEAGRIRSMIKVYSLVTLLWALPLRFLIGFVEALLAPFVRRWTLFAWLRSWLWNVFKLPSTLRARRTLQANSAAGDAELFRYQVGGSAVITTLWAELVAAGRARFPTDDRGGITSLAREVRRPAFGVALAALLFSFAATRQLWSGFPAGRFSLPLPERGADAVAAYAGGWNPAGFGSTEQLPPFLGIAGLWQQVVLDRADLAAGSLALLAFVGGIWGMTRLLRTWGVAAVPGILAGAVLMAGPAARTIAGDGDVATLIALGAVPWVLRVAVAPWPPTWLRRIGRVLAAGWVTGLLANLSPELMVLPVGALLVKAAVDLTDLESWRSALVAAVGAAIAIVLVLPWVSAVDLSGYLSAGEAFWVPGPVLLVAAVIAAAAAILAAPDGIWRIGLWGALVGSAGIAIARSGAEGGGRHLGALGLAAAALGTALVVGAVLEALRRFDVITSTRRAVIALGALGGALLIVSTLLVVAPGRGGLPSDDLSTALRFTGSSVTEDASARVLLVGTPDSLPGTSRRVRGAAYRVVSAPLPALWEVELPAPGPADEALEALLESVIDGGTFRAGEALAGFGIRWIMETADTPLSAVFEGQLDLIPLGGLRRNVFLVDSEQAARALADNGTIWRVAGTGYEGGPAGAVVVRENAHPGWGDDAGEDDWTMTLDGSTGTIAFDQGSSRDDATVALWSGVALIVLSALLRRRW